MKIDEPFLVLKDFRENLTLDIIPGVPTGTDVEDLSGKGHTITKVDAPSRVAGGKYPVLDFTAGGKLTIAYATDINPREGSMSYCFWYKCDTYSGSNYFFLNGGRPFLGPVSIAGKKQFYGYFFDNEEMDEFELYQTAASKQTAGEWYFCVVVLQYDIVAVKLYQDGELILSKNRGAANLYYDYGPGIVIGNQDANQFPGQLAMMRIYNEVLTADQVKQIYQYTRRHVMGLSPKL